MKREYPERKKVKYFPVPTENLKINTILNFNIYIQQQNRFVFFREKHHSFTEEILCRLIENKISKVFVTEEGLVELEKYYSSLEDVSPSGMTKEGFVGPIFDKPENVEQYYKTFFNYYPIERKTLIPGSEINFNIYKKKDINLELYFGPERQQGQQDTVPDDIQKSNLSLVIQNSDVPLYKKYLENITREYSKQEGVSLELKCNIIKENSKLVIKEVLEDPRSGENIKKSSDVVETLVETILDNKDSFYNLIKITSHDYYTYVHSLNVCTLSIGLGIADNQKRESGLMELGLGAILHDIGKSLVDQRIINKPGRLTKDEYKIVQGHVVGGKKLLEKSNTKISQNAFIPILQHHEKLSGEGYPRNLKGEQIHPFGRIAAIVDIYDAVTTDRPYRKAHSPFEALQLISKTKGDYDEELLKKFVMMLGNQV